MSKIYLYLISNFSWDLKKNFSYLLKIEIVALFGLLCAVTLMLILPVRFYQPDNVATRFLLNHYIKPLVVSTVLSILILELINKRNYRTYDFIKLIRILFAFIVIIFLHFNFKLWWPIIHPHTFDSLYYSVDKHMSAIINVFQYLSETFNYNFLFSVYSKAYHDLFVLMFALSFFLHYLLKKGFEDVITATSITLIIGGLFYSVAPAIGPFIFEHGNNYCQSEAQQYMLNFYKSFASSHGKYYAGQFFIAMPAAMPSLHIANSFIFVYFAWRYIKWLLILYVPIFLFLIVESILSKWHYLVDLPMGMIIAIVAIIINKKLNSYRL